MIIRVGKRLLHSKANFVVLDGFLSELLKEEIKIQDVGHAWIGQNPTPLKNAFIGSGV
jgi:hypothetical protein